MPPERRHHGFGHDLMTGPVGMQAVGQKKIRFDLASIGRERAVQIDEGDFAFRGMKDQRLHQRFELFD